jgi:hypothetical protein
MIHFRPVAAALVRRVPSAPIAIAILAGGAMVQLSSIANWASAQEAHSPAGGTVVEPKSGSPERTAILAAVRRAVKTGSRFRVHHLRSTGQWAFFHGTEVVELDEKELQETDLDVAALLERRGTGNAARWTVVELWTLPTEEKHPRARFLERVRARRNALALPAALFPSDF